MGTLSDLTIPAWIPAMVLALAAAFGLGTLWERPAPTIPATLTPAGGLFVSRDGAQWAKIDNGRLYFLCTPDALEAKKEESHVTVP